MENGKLEVGKVVDHIQPHRGQLALFLDETNYQTLCIPCHNIFKRKVELTNNTFGCDINGWPIGPDHYWNGGSPEYKQLDNAPAQTELKRRKVYE